MSKIVGTPSLKFGGHDFGKMFKVAMWAGCSTFATVLIERLTVVDWASVLNTENGAVYAVAIVNVLAYMATQFFANTEVEVD